MATKLRAQQQAPAAAVVALLLAACLVLSATVASARPLKPSSSEGEEEHSTVVVESPAGDIQTVVGAAEHDGAGGRDGHAFMSIDMLGGIKDSGPSPGAGH